MKTQCYIIKKIGISALLILGSLATGISQTYADKVAFNDALASYNSKDYRTAVTRMETVIKNSPDFAEGYRLIAESYDAMNDSPNAIRFYKKNIEHDPRAYKAMFNLALLQISEKDYEGARESLQKCLAVNPDYGKAKYKLNQLNQLIGTSPAETDIATSTHQPSTTSTRKSNASTNSDNLGKEALEFTNKGIDFYNQKLFRDAAKEFNKALMIKEDARILSFLGRSYLHLNEVNSAIKTLTQAVQLSPKSGEYNYYLAKAFEQGGNTTNAKKYFYLAEKYNFQGTDEKFNSEARKYYNQAVQLQQSGNTADAIPYYRKAIEVDDTNISAYFNLGMAYLELGYDDDALQTLNACISKDITNTKAYVAVGNIYHKQGRLSEAAGAYREAVKYGDNSAGTLKSLGSVYAFMNRKTDAVNTYLRVEAITPDDHQILFNIGVLYHKLDKMYDAIDYFQKTIKYAPDHKGAHMNIVQLLGETGRKEEAIAYAEKLIKLDPNDGDAYYAVAVAYQRLGLWNESKYYEKEARKRGNRDGAKPSMK